jgi:hypothetical protein
VGRINSGGIINRKIMVLFVTQGFISAQATATRETQRPTTLEPDHQRPRQSGLEIFTETVNLIHNCAARARHSGESSDGARARARERERPCSPRSYAARAVSLVRVLTQWGAHPSNNIRERVTSPDIYIYICPQSGDLPPRCSPAYCTPACGLEQWRELCGPRPRARGRRRPDDSDILCRRLGRWHTHMRPPSIMHMPGLLSI